MQSTLWDSIFKRRKKWEKSSLEFLICSEFLFTVFKERDFVLWKKSFEEKFYDECKTSCDYYLNGVVWCTWRVMKSCF